MGSLVDYNLLTGPLTIVSGSQPFLSYPSTLYLSLLLLIALRHCLFLSEYSLNGLYGISKAQRGIAPRSLPKQRLSNTQRHE